MNKERYTFYTISVLAAIAQSSFSMDFSTSRNPFISTFDVTVISITVLLVVLVIFIGNDVLRELTMWQKFGIVISHAIIIFGGSALLHTLLTFILGYIVIGWIGLTVKFILLLLTLIPVFIVLGKICLRITDGRFKVYESSE